MPSFDDVEFSSTIGETSRSHTLMMNFVGGLIGRMKQWDERRKYE